MKVRIGRKRANDKLALHLEIDGDTCRSDIPVSVEAVTANCDDARLCKRCFRAERIATAQDRSTSGGFNRKTDTILCWAVAAIRTPAEKARVAEIAARGVRPVEVVKPRTFAEMRAVNLRTLPQPTEPARYVNKAA